MGGDFKLLIFKRISRDCKVKKLIFSTRHTRCLNESWSPSDLICLYIDDADKHFFKSHESELKMLKSHPVNSKHSGQSCVSDNLR